MKLQPGDTFDEFEVIEHIGSGSFAEVYLAHDSILERKVVLKQLNPDLSHNDSEWNAFINEAQVTASFFHPGIITIHGLRVDEKENSAVLVLEYMDGGTLGDLIKKGSLYPQQLWNLAHQVGGALHYLHSRGVVHRDLKPENILYSQKTGWFKLTDFGLSFHPERPEFEELNSGQPGTLIYMSPEQTYPDTPVNPSFDQYAFAVVLYEALTRRYYLPVDIENCDPAEITLSIRQDDPVPLPVLYRNPELTEKLEDVLMRAFMKKPYHRFSSVKKFVRAFNRIMEDMEAELIL